MCQLSTRVGNELGANNPKNKAKFAAIVGLYFSFILGFLALVVAVMVTKIWASMFTHIEIIALTSTILPIIRLFELRNCPQLNNQLWCFERNNLA